MVEKHVSWMGRFYCHRQVGTASLKIQLQSTAPANPVPDWRLPSESTDMSRLPTTGAPDVGGVASRTNGLIQLNRSLSEAKHNDKPAMRRCGCRDRDFVTDRTCFDATEAGIRLSMCRGRLIT